jgi:hypothetical protein
MNAVAVKQPSPPRVPEVQPLARNLAGAYRDRVNCIKHELGLSTEEAAAKAGEPCSLGSVFTILDRPPEEVTWEDLEHLTGHSPQRTLDRWEEVQEAAREELRSGRRAGGVLLGRHHRPFELARFLVIREELAEGWQPRNGVERQLVDQMAQAQAMVNFWLSSVFSGNGGTGSGS